MGYLCYKEHVSSWYKVIQKNIFILPKWHDEMMADSQLREREESFKVND